MAKFSREAAIAAAKRRLRAQPREKLDPYVASGDLEGAVYVAEKAAEAFAGAFHAAYERDDVRNSRDQREQENG